MKCTEQQIHSVRKCINGSLSLVKKDQKMNTNVSRFLSGIEKTYKEFHSLVNILKLAEL